MNRKSKNLVVAQTHKLQVPQGGELDSVYAGILKKEAPMPVWSASKVRASRPRANLPPSLSLHRLPAEGVTKIKSLSSHLKIWIKGVSSYLKIQSKVYVCPS